MAFLDLFRSSPKPSTGSPKGRSGRAHSSGFIEFEELNRDLVGEEGLRIYDRMWRTDPDVRRSLGMVCNPLIGGTWSVVPFGGDDADQKARDQADAVEWALYDFMRPNLKLHFAEAIPLFTRSGFTPFEEIWRAGDYEGRKMLAPRKLDVRLPRTIYRWLEDDLGDLQSIEQFLPGGDDGQPRGTVSIPARDLVYYRVGAEGDNWEGVSLLRPAYKSWFYKDVIERLDAIAQERESTGFPVVYPPRNAPDEQLDLVEEAIRKMKAGEEAYVVMPGPHAQDLKDDAGQGWRLEVLGLSGGGSSGGGTRDPSKSLEYHKDGIAAAVIAEFMRLGQAGEGARATADVQQDPFYAGVQALADVAVAPFNDELIPRIIALNFDDADGPPMLQMEQIDSTSLAELQTFTSGLVTSGVLTPDTDLEDWLRERGGMPPADPQVRAEKEAQRQEDRQLELDGKKKALEAPVDPATGQPVKPKPGEKPKPGDKPTPGKPAPPGGGAGPKTAARPSGGSGYGRDLRWWEQHMQLAQITRAIDEARDTFQAGAGQAAGELATYIAQTIAAGAEPDPARAGPLEDALHEQLMALYTTGAQTVVDELASQGATQSHSFAQDPAQSMRARARVAANTIFDRIAHTLRRLALAGRKSEGELEQAAQAEATGGLRGEALVHAAPALNEGRADEAQANANRIRGSRYTSILDANRCGPCSRADDDVLRPLEDPVRLRRRPPNPSCEGGDRCRCMEFYELKEETPASGPGPTIPTGLLVPDAEHAVVEDRKVRDYLVDPDAKDGKYPAWHGVFGYERHHWADIASQLQAGLPDCPVDEVERHEYGDRYNVLIPVTGPNGRTAKVFTVWQLEHDGPRLITAYPREEDVGL